MNNPKLTTKMTSPLVLAWRNAMNESTLTNQEKIEATKVLMKLRQAQERNKALFDSLGLDHRGNPLDKVKILKPRLSK
ncbi:hypothetical protein [Polynucleobacter ibericus]|jgi:hypothetical protein|uniref:hypothetical protein n=1 Tax=Polynucleobacter ibericus TaxID=1819725 RepID=UPI001BFDBD37|nr:hypothetical protein [Polynucleobacter ibericus]QWE07918.1 hypothetical protein AOC20_05605 [Polynucleobacter ibericus]